MAIRHATGVGREQRSESCRCPAINSLHASIHPRHRSGRHVFLHSHAPGTPPRLLIEHIDALHAAFATARASRPFSIDAMVVLPDHLHCLWTLPEDDADFSRRWHAIKSAFSRAIPAGERLSPRRLAKGERGVWQRRFWEHVIRDERDFERHADYIHFNPVKHGHVRRVADWPHSTFHRYAERGVYAPDWGASDAVRRLDWE